MAGAQRPGQFRPGELDAADLGPGIEAELLGAARELEWLARREDVGPGPDFVETVMAAVSREPAPRPVAAALGAARRRSPLAALAALGDLWRVAFTGGRPLAARFPAMALVVLLVLGSVGVGAVGAGALAGLLGRSPEATPSLSPSTSASPSPEPSASPSPSPSPTASESPEASGQPEPSESPAPSGTLEPSETPTPTQPTDTPRPTSRPTQTPEVTGTPESSPSPSPSEVPSPSITPPPTETPDSSSGHGGGGG
jgi:hypothetical protein